MHGCSSTALKNLEVSALRKYPSKLFIETTSRCNLNCVMCAKQNRNGITADGDLELGTFTALKDAFPSLDALVLNGIGEPLLNSRLEQFIAQAKKWMPGQSWVGFQSNGLLLNNLRAISLVDAGLDRICLSMDGASPSTFSAIRAGGQLLDLECALSAITAAKSMCARPDMQIGVEYVVMRDNLEELPAALHWAATRGANFAIVSHLHPYDEQHLGQCAYDTCTDEALSLFHVWNSKAELAGVQIERYFELLWKYRKTPEEQRILDFVDTMRADAQYRGIPLDLKRLFAMDYSRIEAVDVAFERAREVARQTGLDLRLPEIVPRGRRSCDFIEQGGAFISWDGSMHPCYQLWHKCHSFANGWLHPVQPRIFGNVVDQEVLDIWNSEGFRSYRENVLRHDYPSCAGCNCSPCDNVQQETFEQDCYVNTEPCGSCLWSSGVFRCLD
ncbi:MAG: radical SAM/SPASM family putative metalloenzyme maturase [Verrucomicrobia bacterium]|nr:radical SAM/SPASM family putative metalloenzyme maturase [Deltaproteobacteria bacterium]